ncbi:Pectinesterase inhibitor [Gossypium australe]|uniref:Pectinesterase inhibitor n=1 Tax=Gossypium australe TaxID=47621 RepID=A0A5B6W4U7_9ROSI|nr:Pectinesterase inhibitor [Gossypium australe]
MGINHFILALIFLTCLFSFSISTNAPPPLSDASGSASLKLYDMIEIMSESPSPFAFDGTILESIDEVLSILPGGVDPALQEISGVEAMDNQTKDALAEVTKLSMDPTTLKNVVPILQTCIDVYNNILNNDQKSLEAISNHNLVKLSTELGANVENILGCENAFKQAKLESPMKEMDAKLAKIISNTLTIGVDMVHF